MENDRVAALVDKQDKATTVTVEEDINKSRLPKKFSALAWFNSKLLPDSVHVGVYKTMFATSQTQSLELLQSDRYKNRERIWTIIMVGGGHFAAGVIDVNKSKGVADSMHAKPVKFLAHKTFHRYTSK